MNGKQHAVMWLGLLLIVTRLFTSDQWGSLWGALSDNKTTALTSAGGKAVPVKGGPIGNITDWSASGGTTSASPASGNSGVVLT